MPEHSNPKSPPGDGGPKREYGQLCGVSKALDMVGERWTLLLIRDLLLGPLRFSELLALEDGIGPNMLTRRMRQLEAQGLVEATRDGRSRHYALTPAGERLRPAVLALGAFGFSYLDPGAGARPALDWFLLSTSRRAAPHVGRPYTIEVESAQGRFSLRLAEQLEVIRGTSVGVDATIRAEQPALAAWLLRGQPWRALEKDGKIQVAGDPKALDALRDAVPPWER